MSGLTVSAHTSKEIVARLDTIAKAERRNRSRPDRVAAVLKLMG